MITGLLSLIREIMQRGPALRIFTLSALSGQISAHHVGPICSRRVVLSKSDAESGRWLVGDRRLTTSKDPHSALIDRAVFSVPLMLAHATHHLPALLMGNQPVTGDQTSTCSSTN